MKLIYTILIILFLCSSGFSQFPGFSLWPESPSNDFNSQSIISDESPPDDFNTPFEMARLDFCTFQFSWYPSGIDSLDIKDLVIYGLITDEQNSDNYTFTIPWATALTDSDTVMYLSQYYTSGDVSDILTYSYSLRDSSNNSRTVSNDTAIIYNQDSSIPIISTSYTGTVLCDHHIIFAPSSFAFTNASLSSWDDDSWQDIVNFDAEPGTRTTFKDYLGSVGYNYFPPPRTYAEILSDSTRTNTEAFSNPAALDTILLESRTRYNGNRTLGGRDIYLVLDFAAVYDTIAIAGGASDLVVFDYTFLK